MCPFSTSSSTSFPGRRPHGACWVASQSQYDIGTRQFGRRFLIGNAVAGGVFLVARVVPYAASPCRGTFYDNRYSLPPSTIELCLANVPGKMFASFTSMVLSAILRWATIMIDSTQWMPEQHEIANRKFALYKERLRPLIAAANLYPPSPQQKPLGWSTRIAQTPWLWHDTRPYLRRKKLGARALDALYLLSWLKAFYS